MAAVNKALQNFFPNEVRTWQDFVLVCRRNNTHLTNQCSMQINTVKATCFQYRFIDWILCFCAVI